MGPSLLFIEKLRETKWRKSLPWGISTIVNRRNRAPATTDEDPLSAHNWTWKTREHPAQPSQSTCKRDGLWWTMLSSMLNHCLNAWLFPSRMQIPSGYYLQTMNSNLSLDGFLLPIAVMNAISILPLLILSPFLEYFSTCLFPSKRVGSFLSTCISKYNLTISCESFETF